jgi:hypothetical protein
MFYIDQTAIALYFLISFDYHAWTTVEFKALLTGKPSDKCKCPISWEWNVSTFSFLRYLFIIREWIEQYKFKCDSFLTQV